MFGKLLKYEFKNIKKWYLALYGGVIALSIILSFWFGSMIQQQDFSSASIEANPYGITDPLIGAISGISTLAFFVLAATLSISTLFLIIRRFKNSVYERQGYLTLTLPVSSHQLILSKLTAALIWSFLSFGTLLLSFFLFVIIVALTNGGIKLSELPLKLNDFSGEFWQFVLGFGIRSLTNAVSSILSIYFAISVGQLFQNYRTAIAFATYFGINIVLSILLSFNYNSIGDSPFLYQIIMDTVLAVAYYAGTYFILKNKVNLQ